MVSTCFDLTSPSDSTLTLAWAINEGRFSQCELRLPVAAVELRPICDGMWCRWRSILRASLVSQQ